MATHLDTAALEAAGYTVGLASTGYTEDDVTVPDVYAVYRAPLPGHDPTDLDDKGGAVYLYAPDTAEGAASFAELLRATS